jgi:hypothetical protein
MIGREEEKEKKLRFCEASLQSKYKGRQLQPHIFTGLSACWGGIEITWKDKPRAILPLGHPTSRMLI